VPPPPPPKRDREPLPNTQPSIDPTRSDDAPWEHRSLGLGIRQGYSTIGTMAFNFRSFGDSLGLSFDLASAVNQLQLQPSLMFKIGSPIDAEAVYFQPYLGIGANAIWNRANPARPETDFGVGLVVLGGMDLGFRAVPNLTASIDLGYSSDSIDFDCRAGCFTNDFVNRLGLNFGIDWYFK